MDIEEYADGHPNFYGSDAIKPELLVLLRKNRFQKIVDIGCGNGNLLYNLHASGFMRGFEETWAVDLSQTRLQDVLQIDGDIKIVQDDAEKLTNLPSDYFDLVLSTQVIEHVQDDSEMLRSLGRICRDKGGMIYLETVFKKPWAWYFNQNRHGETVLDSTHEREYISDQELIPKIAALGLRIVSSTKTVLTFPLVDFLIRRLKVNDVRIFVTNPVLRFLRKISIPVPGYYFWSIVITKP